MSLYSSIGKYGREISAGILSGLLLSLSFPPYPTRFFSLFALVPLFWYFITVINNENYRDHFVRRGFLACYIFGVVFFGILIYWIANVIPDSNVTARWVLAPGVSLLVLYLALYAGIFGLILAFLIKRYGLGAVISAPALFPLMEMARSSGELAFSWGVLPGSLAKYPFAVQGLALYGGYGLSFFIVLVNLLVAIVFFNRSRKVKWLSAAALVIVLAGHLWYGLSRVNHFHALAESSIEKNIAVIQPNVGLDVKWKPEYKQRIFREIEDLTAEAAENGAELVIFPETSAPVSISRSEGYREWLERIARVNGVELLIGFIDHKYGKDGWNSYNGAGLFNSEGELISRYYKINLLPFGEKIPFSSTFPSLAKIRFGQANFTGGNRRTIFRSDAGDFGVLICFESTFASQSRDYVRRGADFLVNITNDGWFNGERGPIQHSETAILRAVENGVYMLRSANTGVSLLIDPAGTVIDRLALNREGIIYCAVSGRPGFTPYTRFGDVVYYIFGAISLAAAVLFSRRSSMK